MTMATSKDLIMTITKNEVKNLNDSFINTLNLHLFMKALGGPNNLINHSFYNMLTIYIYSIYTYGNSKG